MNSGLPSRFIQILNNLNLANYVNTDTNNKNKKKSTQFASHFMIAGRKFKNIIDETQAFLFGDHVDLSFILAHKPVVFPYGTPQPEVPSKYLQSLIHIRKDTIRLVKTVNTDAEINENEAAKYNIEFRFDCDCDVRIKIHYFAHEKFTLTSNHRLESTNSVHHNLRQLFYNCGCSNFISRSAKGNNNTQSSCFCLNDPESNVYTTGANILFHNPNHAISPAQFDYKAWQFNINSNYFPVVIECTPVSSRLATRHAHITLAYIDKSLTNSSTNPQISNTIPANSKPVDKNDEAISTNLNNSLPHYNYQIKPIKQKQLIDGVLYSLQEIYGIEKKVSSDLETLPEQCVSEELKNSCTSSSIATQNSNITLSCSKSVTAGSSSGEEITNEEFLTILNIQKKRQIEHEIEQEMKGIECVICMCETRDTLILPCRHLCLCKLCAINLRVQSSNCPICRIPFVALLQLKLVKKKNFDLPNSPSTSNDNLPIIRMENLPIVRIENLSGVNDSMDISHENVIIEEGAFQITQAECQDRGGLLCMSRPDLIGPPKLMSMYETVTIYEAFNSFTHSSSNQILNEYVSNESHSRTPNMNKSKRFKIKILDPIKSSSDFVQNLNEVESNIGQTFSEKKIPKLFEFQDISIQKNLYGLKTTPNDLRCSSVVLNRTANDSFEKKQSIYRAASYVDNFRQMSKFNESIQMDEMAPSNHVEI